ncbi:hypothetical protein FOMPIDRAFT_88939 [Fomitopsis schrenkii]|uniref:Uncharacterized protein n=1 Tax=Fomitopsis schrenkii TaxID=2126942 RepID=S8F3S7_FOMSC|nr:hypothetical protein FOMPIDRAFT_88939 [Fomitopsis schrenkii]
MSTSTAWFTMTSIGTSTVLMSTSTAWLTTTSIGTSTVISTITAANSPLQTATPMPSPTVPTSMSAMQVVGIATAVVFGTLLLLAMGAAITLYYRRVKPPSHSFAPLKNTDDEPVDESHLILHISHDKTTWVPEEAEPLAWRAPPQPHTSTTPVSSGASYIGTMATVGSAVDLEVGPRSAEHTDRRELFEERMRHIFIPSVAHTLRANRSFVIRHAAPDSQFNIQSNGDKRTILPGRFLDFIVIDPRDFRPSLGCQSRLNDKGVFNGVRNGLSDRPSLPWFAPHRRCCPRIGGYGSIACCVRRGLELKQGSGAIPRFILDKSLISLV